MNREDKKYENRINHILEGKYNSKIQTLPLAISNHLVGFNKLKIKTFAPVKEERN